MSPSRIDGTGYFPRIVRTTGMRVARWMGMAVAWARVSPSRVKRLADASSPSFTMGENELRTRVDCISFAMPSSLLRTTSRVIGSEAAGFGRYGHGPLNLLVSRKRVRLSYLHPAHERRTMHEAAIRVHIEPLDEGGFLATSPDVPGLVAEGRSITEAAEVAQGLARKIAESCIEHGDPLPRALAEHSKIGIEVDLLVPVGVP